MTDTKTASQVLSDEQIQEMWYEACKDGPGKPGWARHIRLGRAVESAILAQQAATPAPDAQAGDLPSYNKGNDQVWFAARQSQGATEQPAKSAVPAGERETISKALGEILGVMRRSGFEFDRDAPLVNEANRWIEWQASAAQPRQGVELTDARIVIERAIRLLESVGQTRAECDSMADDLRAILATHSGAETSDSARLDYVISHGAWIVRGHDRETCRVFYRNGALEIQPIMGWNTPWFSTAREAIDAAIAAERARQAGSNTGDA